MNPWMLFAVILGLLGGGVLMVLIVQPGIDLLRRFIGRDRCFGSEALNGCATWGNGTLLCGVMVLVTWRVLGFRSLLCVPMIPVAATLIWTGYFSLKAALVRKREFAVKVGGIYSLDGPRIDPEFVVHAGWYDQTGPGTGYPAFAIQLGRGRDVIATNVYVDEVLAQRTLDQVMQTAGPNGCRLLDVSFVARIDQATWHVVSFNAPWAPLLCGQLERIPESDRAWWRQWCQPDFGALGRTEVDRDIVVEKLDRLIEAYPWIVDADPEDGPEHDSTPTLNLLRGTVRLRDNICALRALLAQQRSVEIVTHRAHRAEVDSVREQHDGGVELSFSEDGIEVQTVKRYE